MDNDSSAVPAPQDGANMNVARGSAYRPLLPKLTANPPVRAPEKATAKRSRVSGACAACRTRKTKCDSLQPKCGECNKRHTQCIYELPPAKRRYGDLANRAQQLENSQSVLQQLVHALQTRPDADARAILQRLREGHDIESIVRHLTAGDLLLQLHVRPETKSGFAFPFQHKMPSFLQASDSPYLSSVLFHTTFTVPEGQGSSFPSVEEVYSPEYLKPYSSATIVDQKLENVKPSTWTHVSKDDDLLRLLLKLYFQYEYPTWQFFQKDLFLDDMLSGSKKYCSSLLVNAVLAHACHCHLGLPDRLQYWNPHNLGYKFFAEAKRIWQEEGNQQTSITRVQTAMIMFQLYAMYSMDKLGMTYAVQAVTLGQELGIFGHPRQAWSKVRKQAYAYTAWSVHYYVSIFCYHFLIPPILKETPKTPLPTFEEDPKWYGEFYLRYPLSEGLTSMGYGLAFRAHAELSVIINDLSRYLFDRESGTESSSQKLIKYATKLMAWYSTLPVELAPQKLVFPFQFQIHLLYHNVLINLCEAIMSSDESTESSQLLDTIPEIARRSKIDLEIIIRMSYLRHSFDRSDPYQMHFLTVLAFLSLERLKVIRAPDTPSSSNELKEMQSTLILAAKGLHDQGKNYYLSYTVFHMLCNEMGSEELNIMCQYASIPKEDLSTSKLRAKHVQGHYPINVLNYADDPKQQRLAELAQQYENMALESSGSDEGEVGSP